MPRKNYYDLLEIDRDADTKTIKRAYRRMVRLYHPDTGTSSLISPERFQQIIEAYNVLRNPEKRAQYDRIINRPPIRIMESDWVYQPQPKARTSPRETYRPKTSASSKARPKAPTYRPKQKTLTQQIRQYAIFPILLGVASLILFGVIRITEAVVQPDVKSLVTSQATVEDVDAYDCDDETCYYVTYSYYANGRQYRNYFSSERSLYFVGASLSIQYYWDNPSTSIYTPPENENNHMLRYFALITIVAVVVLGGWLVARQTTLRRQAT